VDLVARTQLLQQLEQNRQRPLTLVCAPAGYGKSILVSHWLETCDCPSAWVSLDDKDNDLRQFLSYFLAAVETLFPDALRKTRALIEATTLPPLSRLTESLINDLDRIERAFVLVLDDYHRIRANPIHNLLTELLRHPPQRLHLVLAGRNDPPMPLHSLRALGQLSEIRLQDLRFTSAETAEFLQHLLRAEVDAAVAAAWQEKTEGWVAGLRMASLVLGREGDVGGLLPAKEWGTQEAREFLFNEVLSRQPPDVRRRLLRTAILDRFCAPLCDAIGASSEAPAADAISGWEFIDRLKKENVFVIPLDTENRWFRYHHLFQQLLQNQLERHTSSEDINALHARASGWFAKQGLIEEALQHALAGCDPTAAVRLVARHGFDLTNDEQWPRLERWLHLLSRDIVDQHPGLLLLEGWLHTVYTRPAELAACLQKAEAVLSASPQDSEEAERLQGHFDALRSFQHFLAADGGRALASTGRACEKLPDRDRWARIFMLIIRSGAHQMVGDLPRALSVVQGAMADKTLLGAASQGYLLANPCFIHWMVGDLRTMRRQAAYAVEFGEDRDLPQALAHGRYFLGVVQYQQNELDAAETSLAAVIENPYNQHALNFANSAFILALILQNRGRTDEADKVCGSVVSYALDTANAAVMHLTRAFQAELALRQGRLAEASQWAEQFVVQPAGPRYRFYVPQLTFARVLLAQGTTGSRAQVTELLDSLHDFVLRIHTSCFRIDVLALQALLCDARGEEPAALEKLSAALALAEPGGFIRVFVDLGPQMADLLTRLIKQKDVNADYVGQLLTAFREDERAAAQSETTPPTASSPSSTTFDSGRFLTERELETLVLLERRFRNNEIAERLFVSPETVKTHLQHIYKKLNASNRRQAVDRARALGVLPQR
jgi:LuxR family maltose regulon positive regulatory protein